MPGLFLYNPVLLPRRELESLFLVRHSERDQILDRLRKPGASPQHMLVIGEPGMGKTTLLVRLAHAVEDDPVLGRRWLPVRFDEEQYNVGELADFWLNCMEKIGEDTGDPRPFQTADELLRQYKGSELEEAAFLRLREYSLQKGRHLLLLVDNLDLVLSRIDPERETNRLREVLLHEPWLVLVGAATDPILATFHYEHPFYELFQVIALEPLSREEVLHLLRGLGRHIGKGNEISLVVEERRDVLAVLHILTGGNLRSTVILFSILQEHPGASLAALLDHLLDRYTSLYKDRIEALPAQGQRVFDALARSWDPTTAERVASELRIERGIASGQLHRLVERGLATKVQLPERSMGFQVRDRFFNLWYLMRGGRRRRHRLRSLVAFVDLFYRPARPSGEFERLVAVLVGAGLVSLDEVESARAEARRHSQPDEREQGDLFRGSPSVKIQLLALYCAGQLEAVGALASELLRFGSDPHLVGIVQAYALEQQGKIKESLAVLDAAIGTAPPPRLQLERARLLLDLGRVNDAERALSPLFQFDEISPSELAITAAGLARRQGSEGFAWLVQGLLRSARTRSPGAPQILLATCEIELSLGRPQEALKNFREAIAAVRQDGAAEQWESLLETAFHLASVDLADELLKLLEETGLAEEWQPLAHALALLGGDADRLEKLSPEMRALTRLVEDRLQEVERSRAATAQRRSRP